MTGILLSPGPQWKLYAVGPACGRVRPVAPRAGWEDIMALAGRPSPPPSLSSVSLLHHTPLPLCICSLHRPRARPQTHTHRSSRACSARQPIYYLHFNCISRTPIQPPHLLSQHTHTRTLHIAQSPLAAEQSTPRPALGHPLHITHNNNTLSLPTPLSLAHTHSQRVSHHPPSSPHSTPSRTSRSLSESIAETTQPPRTPTTHPPPSPSPPPLQPPCNPVMSNAA